MEVLKRQASIERRRKKKKKKKKKTKNRSINGTKHTHTNKK